MANGLWTFRPGPGRSHGLPKSRSGGVDRRVPVFRGRQLPTRALQLARHPGLRREDVAAGAWVVSTLGGHGPAGKPDGEIERTGSLPRTEQLRGTPGQADRAADARVAVGAESERANSVAV